LVLVAAMAIAATAWMLRDTAPEPRPPSKARAVTDRGDLMTPDLVGMPLARAIEFAKRDDISLFLDEERYASEPLGTIVAQTPGPHVRQTFGARELSLTLAAPRARACRTRDLVGRFSGTSRAMGQVFGGAVVANRSASPCRLHGRLRLRGLAQDGDPVTRTVSRRIDTPLVLSPRSSPESVPPALLAELVFVGNQRDDPDSFDGQCYHRRTPATWEVRLSTGARVRFPNVDVEPESPAYSSCHGDLHFELGPNIVGAYGTGLVRP
jgi:hypothetical protein